MPTTTRIDVSAAPDHQGPRVIITHGALQVRRLREAGPTVRLALVAAQALLLAGDEVRVEVRVHGPVHVEIVETAGTVAYDMRGGAARWDLALELLDGAMLTWRGQPFVVSAGADVRRETVLYLGEGCRSELRETVVLGRAGEEGGSLTAHTHIDLAGEPLLVEELDLSAGARAGWATLRGHRCLDTVTTAGYRLAEGVGVLQLEGRGSVHRWIGDELHLASPPISRASPQLSGSSGPAPGRSATCPG